MHDIPSGTKKAQILFFIIIILELYVLSIFILNFYLFYCCVG
jgi:hypothetical protein